MASFFNYLSEKLTIVRQRSVEINDTESKLTRCSLSDYCLQSLDEPIFTIPEEVLLNIFSYLSANDLVTVSKVCKLWNRVSSDHLLWEHRLKIESESWPCVTSGTTWSEIEDDDEKLSIHPKLLYLQCSFFAQPFAPSFFRNLTNLWRSVITRKKPKFVLTGPGLESKRTCRFVRRMVSDKCVEFEPVSMISGQNGFGTGLTLKLSLNEESYLFDLVTLYSGRQQDRGDFNSQEERIKKSLLFNNLAEGSALDKLQATDQVRTLFENVDALVFAIDAEDSPDEISVVRHELKSLINAFPAGQPPVPILAISLLEKDESSRKVSAFHVAKSLCLFTYPNEWFVQDSIVKDLTGFSRGFHWIIQKWLTM